MAYASWMTLNPGAASVTDLLLTPNEVDDHIDIQVAIANPGSLVNEPILICLRNAEQVACNREADIWSISLLPNTLAIMPAQIQASSGDRLTFLSLAEEESKRIDLGSQMVWAYVGTKPLAPAGAIAAPTQLQVLGGCNFVALTTDPNASVAPSNLFYDKQIARGTKLYLLIQLCEPNGDDYVQLAIIADRKWVVQNEDRYWQQPLRLIDTVSVIPLDTAKLASVHEFQIAVLPLSEAATEALHGNYFSQAIVLSR